MLHLALFINQSRMPSGEVSLRRTVPCALSSPNTNFVDREPFDRENLSANQKISNFTHDFSNFSILTCIFPYSSARDLWPSYRLCTCRCWHPERLGAGWVPSGRRPCWLVPLICAASFQGLEPNGRRKVGYLDDAPCPLRITKVIFD